MAADSSAPLWISVGSFIVSGIALGWNIYRDAIDRGKLQVRCYIGQVGQMGVGVIADNLLVWQVTNVGRQPVMVSQLGGRRKKVPPHWVSMGTQGDQLPKMLNPGEYCSCFTGDLGGVPPDTTELWALDTLGRYHRASKKQVKAALEAIAEKRAKGELKEP